MIFRPVEDYDRNSRYQNGDVVWGMDGHIWIYYHGIWRKRETRWFKE